jgi:hypothetical protein
MPLPAPVTTAIFGLESMKSSPSKTQRSHLWEFTRFASALASRFSYWHKIALQKQKDRRGPVFVNSLG